MPYWARTALRWVRAHRRNTGLELHRTLVRRFAAGWPYLQRDVWPQLFKRAASAGQHLHDENANLWGRGVLPALVLECAYWWAAEDEATTARTRVLAAEVQKLDVTIMDLAERLAAALRRRTEIREMNGIGTEWSGPGLVFEDVIEATVESRPGYQYRVQEPLGEFLQRGRQTSASSPSLADLLGTVTGSAIGPVWASDGADLASLGKIKGGNAEADAVKVRRFFAMLGEQQMADRAGRLMRPLYWLTAKGIATLLCVAVGEDPESSMLFLESTVKKYRQRW